MSILTAALFRFGGALAVALATSAGPASAADGSFSIAPQTVIVSGGAGHSVTVSLPGNGSSGFFIDFVLPSDYLKNGRVKIVLYLTDAVGGCTARLVAQQLVRRRSGVPSVNSLSGLTESAQTVALARSTVVAKTITLRRGTQPVGQRPGDAIALLIVRQGDDAADTCDRVFVQAIDVRYPRL